MILIRIVSPSGSIEPVILEQAENIQVFEAVGSSDEGVSFEIAKNAPKADILNPDNRGYAYFWEAWDTATNSRINYGPIKNITESGPSWKVSGAGRSALLDDIRSTNRVFYAAIDKFVDDLRYENIAVEPRTKTLVWSGEDDSSDTPESTVFADPDFDDRLSTLSSRTKDNAIDDEDGLIPLGKAEPSRSFFTTKSFWSGTAPKDTLLVDLGAEYSISKIKLLFPWWGGKTRSNDRSYDFDLAYTTEIEPTTYAASGIYRYFRHPVKWTDFTNIYRIGTHVNQANRLVTHPQYEMEFNLGYTNSGEGYGFNRFNTLLSTPGPTTMRYIRVAIKNVNAWYGNVLDDDPGHNGWDYQCNPDYVAGGDSFFGSKTGIMKNSEINDRVLEAANDCNASIVEVGAMQEIIGKDTIRPLAMQKIDNNNLQITYTHTPETWETRTATNGQRKFEPGTFFRNIIIDYSGASSNYTKFFNKDCTNCYPDGFHFGVLDNDQNVVYMSDNSSGSNIAVRTKSFASYVWMKGSANATVTSVDAWRGQTDPLSYGGSHSFSEVAGDTATVHFRGQSFRWYATVPEGKTGATVKIEYRNKTNTPRFGIANIGHISWSGGGAWTTLVNNYKIPDNISASLVYEITYESGTLAPDTVYEIRITNLDGNYCSVDSFEGYWSASFTMYNEDSSRIKVSRETAFKQIYDKRFNNGSMYKWNASGTGLSMVFEGDRLVIVSAKGRNHGKLRVLLYQYDEQYGLYDPGESLRIYIPGGNADGTYTINLGTAKRANESTQHVVFDTNEIFGSVGLPWGKYGLSLSNYPIETYSTTKNEVNSDSFVYRCQACKADASGSKTINKYVYLDSIGVHETIGLSVVFDNETNLNQLKSVADALQVEWDITEQGVVLEPRVGTDTDYSLREGANTLVDFEVVNDVNNVASILYSYGADIDGLPLFTITEDKIARDILGRTVMRQEDFRDVGDYQQLVGISRGSLRKRRVPEKRITITHLGDIPINKGDSFNLVTTKRGEMRVRAVKKVRSQTSAGTTYQLECVTWPQIV